MHGHRRGARDHAIARAGALRLDPGNYLATLRLAYACYSLGQHPEALALYRRLSEQYPSDVEVRAGLGWALVKLGKSGDAQAAFREVLELSPRHASAKEGLLAAGTAR